MLFTKAKRFARWAPLVALVALAACSEAGPTANSAGILSGPEADELAEVISADADAFADATTFDDRQGLRLEIFQPMMGRPRQLLGRAGCHPVPSDSNPPNLDGDRVPDALLLDFSGVSCSVRDHLITLDGTLGIEDPAVPGFGLRLVFTDLNKTVALADGSRPGRSVTWNGTRQIVGSPSNPGSQLTHTITNFNTKFAFSDGNEASHDKNWNGAFVADVPGSIQHGIRLPSGTWTFDGNSTWQRNGADGHGVSIRTLSPLHFNADCRVAPRFDSGLIEAVVSRQGTTTVITIEHPQCGQKIVTRERGDT